ncbi:MAG: hypothetical protein IPL61_25180 [Myxococcales bacterium]|nr:hypothetical protein [Myxococcales bacterium]
MRNLPPLMLAVAIGCAGGGTVTSSSPPARSAPISIATTPTDHQLAALTPAPLTAGAAGLDAAIASYYERAATRRGYLQTDKPLYQPGETIWFRADLRTTGTMLAGPALATTVQLVSPRGAIVATKLVLVQHGVARNDVALAETLEGGEYTLKLTAADGTTDERKLIINTYEAPRLQKTLELLRKAYGAGDAVAAAIEIKQATGEPFADRALTGIVTIDDVEVQRLALTTNRDGKTTARFTLPTTMARGDGLLTILAEDGGVTESIQKRIPIVMTSLQLGLFPEGGDLIDGLPGRVYVMARTLIGKPADVEGQVVDDRGRVVAEFTSIHDGLGRFELTPETDRRYQVVITRPAGITARYPVPAAQPGGCVIRSVDPTTPDVVRVAALCDTARHLEVVAVMRERRLGSGGFDVAAGQPTVVEIPADPKAQGQGVVRVTLFSSDRAPLAERLVYHNRGADLRVELTADKPTYTPREPVKLRVKTTDAAGKPVAASVAVAVVDETVLAFADDKSARILARMYLEPELGATGAEPIEEPNFYFSDQPEAAAAMDALLATRGYRRFEWRPITAALGGTP